MALLEVLFPLALVALALVALVALRHRILAVMAWRNALRRPRQSILVILGLLVGTAIVSAALVSGDSMEYAIVEATYDAFQSIDETVFLDGYNFFPEYIADDLAADPQMATLADAIGRNILWSSAAVNERTQLYEPNIRLVGFDPEADRPWGPFTDEDGNSFDGVSLSNDEVVLGRTLARRLDARVGDELNLTFIRPQDPLLPRIRAIEGRINVTAGGIPPLTEYADPQPWLQFFPLRGTAVHLSAGIRWDPGMAGQDLDLEFRHQGMGRRYFNNNGSVGAPDGSLQETTWLNITGTLTDPVPSGQWFLYVRAKAAAQTPFAGVIIQVDPVYNLTEYEKRVEELRIDFPDEDPSQFEDQLHRDTRHVRVAWIMDGGKGPNFALPTNLNAYMRLNVLQDWLGRSDQVNFVKVSNPGGVEEGAEATDEVYPILWDRLNVTKSRHLDHPAIQALKANNDKEYWLDQAATLGETFSIFLVFLGSLSVVAGLMLIINIFTMLAEERKTELGISRAVGLQRAHLTRLFTLEGALYALPAAALGTFGGLLLARGLIAGFNYFGDPDNPNSFPPIPFRLEEASLYIAFATGILLTLGTVYLGARRVSRLNVVRAIRSLEEPEIIRSGRSLVGGLILLLLGLGLSLWGFAADHMTGIVLGPSALALGAGLLLRRLFHRRRVYPPIAAALFLYLATTYFTIKRYDTLEDNIASPIRSVVMALALVVILVHTETAVRAIGRLAARIGPLRPVALVATSYPLNRKFRSGITLAMFAVILLMVSLFSIMGAIFAPNADKEAGGYDIQAYAQEPIDRLEDRDGGLLDRFAYYDLLPHYLQYGSTFIKVENETTAQFGPPRDTVFGIDEQFARQNEFRLLRRDATHASDEDAYLAVARSDDLVIVSYPYSVDEQGRDDAHGVGDPLTVEARGGRKTFLIAGVQEQVHFKGVFVSQGALDSLFANTNTLALITLQDGEDPEATAKDLEASYRDVGMDAASIRQEVVAETEQFRQIFTLIQLFLSLGLIVGILSLGIVTARSVIERRQEIGMMRALGYRRRDIRRTFLLEMLTTVGLGVLVGAVVALIVSFGIWVALVRELNIPYQVPVGELVVIALIAFVATTLATLAPIIRASRIPPAEALRYIE